MPNPRPGENPLSADPSKLLLQIREQRHLQLVARSEVDMSALTRKRMMPESIPIKPRHAKPGLRRNDRPIPLRIVCPGTQRDEVRRLQRINSIRVSFQVIQQPNRSQF